MYPMPNQAETPEKPETGTKMKAFVTGAIIAGSALVGGLAVVLWNRKALSGLRQHAETDQNPSEEEDGLND
jgi:hypothetical protein